MARVSDETSRLMHEALGWYNTFPEPDGEDRNTFRPSFDQSVANRQTKLSLHGYQEFSEGVECGLEYWTSRDRSGLSIKLNSRYDTHVTCFVEGGVESPNIRLTLRLCYKDQGNPKAQSFVRLTMRWMAWDPKGCDMPRRTPQGDYHFSGRLGVASLQEIELSHSQADMCQAKAGQKGFRLRWGCEISPVCFGFALEHTPMNVFNEMQKSAVKQFIGGALAQRLVVYTRRTNITMLQNWNLLTSMPVPPLPQYPLYDCRYHHQERRFEIMNDIPASNSSIIEMHHQCRLHGWASVTGQAKDRKLVPRKRLLYLHPNPPTAFLNEREYQSLQSIAMLREVEAISNQENSLFDREYTFQLFPAGFAHGNLSSQESTGVFYIALQIDLRIPDADLEQTLELPAPGRPIVVIPTYGARRETQGPVWEWKRASAKPKQVASSGPIQIYQPPPAALNPKPTTPASQGDQESLPTKSDRWKGVIVSSAIPDIKGFSIPDNVVIARITQPHTDNRTGRVYLMTARVQFTQANIPVVPITECIQSIMWGNSGLHIPRETPLKDILLSHDNHITKFRETKKKMDPKVMAYINSLGPAYNEQQKEAIREALSLPGEFMTLITGPPGTGKTAVSSAIIRYCYIHKIPILVVCASNKALDGVAERFSGSFQDTSKIERVYRLGTEFSESSDIVISDHRHKEVSELDAKTIEHFRELYGLTVNDQVIQALANTIKGMGTNLASLSLGIHIMSQVRKMQVDRKSIALEEAVLIAELTKLQHLLEREGISGMLPPLTFNLETRHLPSSPRALQNAFLHSFKRLQEHYIKEAKVIFTTATTAARDLLRSTFAPSFILIEEGSQIHEFVSLLAMVPYYSSARRVIISGDKAQLAPCVCSDNQSEAAHIAKYSLFERMLDSGMQDKKLLFQYRMAPDIAGFVSQSFYDGLLRTHTSCGTRKSSKDASEFFSRKFSLKGGNSCFVSITGSVCLRRTSGASFVNPFYITYIVGLVREIAEKFQDCGQILVLSFYSEERKALTSLFQRLKLKVQVASVDAAQGAESSIVILSTTRPGQDVGLGFLVDPKRMCVALSRARDYLIVVGDVKMGDSQGLDHRGGSLLWQRFVDYHRGKKTVVYVTKSDKLSKDYLGIFKDSPGWTMRPKIL